MENYKISVALTTYNGEKYIEQQLDSILQQTRVPDELIVCDDCSEDSTPNIIASYIENHKLNNWFLIINRRQLGWKENFRKCISACSGDIIFFSDQDDRWIKNKIETMYELMIQKSMGSLFAENLIINSKGEPVRGRNKKVQYSGQVKKIELTPHFFHVKTLGCCMCINADVKKKYLDLNCTECNHDSQCGRIALLYFSLWHYDFPVIEYRIHNNNTSGISIEQSYGASNLNKRIEEIKESLYWLERVKLDCSLNTTKQSLIDNAILFQNKRLSYIQKHEISFIKLLKERRMYPNLTMLVGDFAYKHRINKLLGRFRWNMRNMRNIFCKS